MPRNKKPEAPTPQVAGSAEALITEHFSIRAHLDTQQKQFDEYCKTYRTQLELIDSQLMAILNAQGLDAVKSDAGTAYKSTLLNTSVSADETQPYVNQQGQESRGREAVLDFCLDNWDSIGNELLLVGVQKDAIRRHMEENAGQPPPGVKVGWFTRINYRKS